MSMKRLGPIAGLTVAGLLLAASCGGTDSSSENEAGADTTSAPTTATEPGTTEAAAAASAEDTAEITSAYQTFFTAFAGDPALLEDGETMTAGIESLRSTAATVKIAINVQGVSALDEAGCSDAGVPSPCASVKFDLVVNDDPKAVPDQTGYAVRQDDKWKVAKTTFCSLASLGGSLPAGC